MPQQIILNNMNKPTEGNLYGDITWVGESFGLNFGRDTGSIAMQLFKEILTNKQRPIISSNLLAEELNVAIGVVNYHLRNLIDSGLFCREKRLIVLRGGSLKAAVQETRKDTNRIFDKIELIAGEIDEALGIKNRS
jgi:predicted transcriptional regulator